MMSKILAAISNVLGFGTNVDRVSHIYYTWVYIYTVLVMVWGRGREGTFMVHPQKAGEETDGLPTLW